MKHLSKKLINNTYSKLKLFFLASLPLTFISCLVFSFFIPSPVYSNYVTVNPDTLIVKQKHNNIEIVKDSVNYKDSIDSLRNSLILSVDSYMRSVYPKTKLSSENIVDLCIKYDFDIPLLLAQAQQESCFGKAVRHNSVFGVLSGRYSHVNESVEDYILLMRKSYVRTRTPEQCIAAKFYVEGSKKYKYAGDPNYAKTINKHRTNIIKTTPIQKLHKQLRNYWDKYDSIKLEQNPRLPKTVVRDGQLLALNE